LSFGEQLEYAGRRLELQRPQIGRANKLRLEAGACMEKKSFEANE